MRKKIGLIAEDLSDVQVAISFIKKIQPQKVFSYKYYLGKGCGDILGKCRQWADILKSQGCNYLIVLQDLDLSNLKEIFGNLNSALLKCKIENRVIVIPIMEIEAWLLSDHKAIKNAMNLKADVKKIPNPQSILDPKQKLAEIIYFCSGKKKRYINNVHNPKIASCVEISNIRRCDSFLPLEKFVVDNFS
jgi:hypothetical protein